MNTGNCRNLTMLFLVLLVAGCGDFNRGINDVKQQVRSAKKETMARLKKIQQHGLIDLEVQQQLTNITSGFQNCVQQAGTPPADWNQLLQYAQSNILAEDVMRQNPRIAFGLTASQWKDPELQEKYLLLMPKAFGDGGWGLTIDGQMSDLNSEDFNQATLAGSQ